MNFFFTLFLSVLSVSVHASDSSSSSSSTCSSESSSCDIISSSSNGCSAYLSSPRVCAKELAMIEEQPCLPAVNYLRKLEAEVRANFVNWLTTSTRTETIVTFCNTYGIMVNLIGPMGYGIMFPNPVLPSPFFDVSYMRAMALNKGVYQAGEGPYVFYSFPLRSPDGAYVIVQFMVPRSQLPLNNIKYKRDCLYN